MYFRHKQRCLTTLWTILTLLLLLCAVTALAAGSGTCGDRLTWTLNKDGLLTISGSGEMKTEGFSPDSWYDKRDEIRRVVIDKGAVNISEKAFADCKNLSEVEIRSGLQRIEKNAFSDCPNLKRISIPDTVKEMKEWFGTVHHRFYIQCNPGSYAETYARRNGISFHNKNCPTFGYEITNVNQKADWVVATYVRSGMSEYEKAAVLHDWIVHNAVYDLSVSGNSAAHILVDGRGVCGCYTLAYSMLLKKVGIESQYVQGTVFDPNDHAWNFVRIDGKWYHTDVTWDDTGSDFSSRAYFLVKDEVMLKNRTWDRTKFHTDEELTEIVQDGLTYRLTGSSAAVIRINDRNTKTLIIPNTVAANGKDYYVNEIRDAVFKNMAQLESVSIGASVRTIGRNAFIGCKKLKTVTGGRALRTIGDSAFSGCAALKEITLNSQVQKIGKKAFFNCAKLKTIKLITRRLTDSKVGASAFKGIYSKARIYCPKSVQKKYQKFLLKKGITKDMKVIGE